jgi:hypothetical protein
MSESRTTKNNTKKATTTKLCEKPNQPPNQFEINI